MNNTIKILYCCAGTWVCKSEEISKVPDGINVCTTVNVNNQNRVVDLSLLDYVRLCNILYFVRGMWIERADGFKIDIGVDPDTYIMDTKSIDVANKLLGVT